MLGLFMIFLTVVLLCQKKRTKTTKLIINNRIDKDKE